MVTPGRTKSGSSVSRGMIRKVSLPAGVRLSLDFFMCGESLSRVGCVTIETPEELDMS